MATLVRVVGEGAFVDGRRYRKGDEFVLPSRFKPGKGLEVIGKAEEPKAKAPKASKGEPATFSEITRQTVPRVDDGLI